MRIPAPWQRRQPELALPGDAPSVVFVFSGGGSLGAAQVGAARALIECGVRPDAVVGCSVGALNAAFLAAAPTLETAAELETIWRGVTTRDVFGSGRHRTLGRLVLGRPHVADPDALRGLIRRFSPIADLSDTRIPCHVVTTDLISGMPSCWSSGPALEILAASACLPGLFPPVELSHPDGTSSFHVDGGVLVPVPSGVALALGARTVYVIDVSDGHLPSAGPAIGLSALGVLLRSFAVARAALQAATEPRPGPGQQLVALPHPPTAGIDIRDFSHTSELVDAGYRLTREFLDTRAGQGDQPHPDRSARNGLLHRRRSRPSVVLPAPAGAPSPAA